jgi:hypothetical protein
MNELVQIIDHFAINVLIAIIYLGNVNYSYLLRGFLVFPGTPLNPQSLQYIFWQPSKSLPFFFVLIESHCGQCNRGLFLVRRLTLACSVENAPQTRQRITRR